MYSLLIVDDEPVVRQGICEAIDWSSIGVSVSGKASNANDAISIAIRLKPDIILCDIRMPDNDGFFVIHTIKQLMPEVQFILISGYTDQEYMLEAIRCGVRDYLLKPASLDDIRHSVHKICIELENNNKTEKEKLLQNKLLTQNMDTLRNQYIEKILQGTATPDEISDCVASMHLPLKGPFYQLLLSDCYNSWENIQFFTDAFRNYQPVIEYYAASNTIAVILNVPHHDTSDQLEQAMSAFQSYQSNCIVAVSPICDSLCGLAAYTHSMSDMLQRKIWYNPNQFYRIDPESFPVVGYDRLQQIEHDLLNAVKEKRADYAQMIDSLFDHFSSYKIPQKNFYEEIKHIAQFFQITYASRQLDASIEICNDFLSQLEQLTVCDIKQWIIKISEMIIRYNYGKGLVGKALASIEQNYTVNLTLNQIAAELYISPSYLSRILKKKTGRGFQEWLHEARIKRAKQLLSESDYTTYRIAEMVGYSTYKLFSSHFKQLTGITAREYRNTQKEK